MKPMKPNQRIVVKSRVACGFVLATLLVSTSCIFPGTTQKVPSVKRAQPAERKHEAVKPLIFKSKEFVVYRLEANTTAERLAAKFLRDRKKAWVIEDENGGKSYRKGQVVVIPLIDRNRGGFTKKGYQVVPVLVYHKFSKSCNTSMCIPTVTFDRQMRYLKNNGYRVIRLKDLLGFLQYRQRLPSKSVVITVDDGYRSFYDIAYPILKKYGFKATIFVYTDFIGRSKSGMTWNQIKRVKAQGFEVGSHGLSHSNFTNRKDGEGDQAYIARIKRELIRSKQIIDQKLKQETIHIAFPFGSYNQTVLQICEQAGYKIGLSVRSGGNPFFADPLSLKRDQITKKDLRSFIKKLDTFKVYAFK